MILWLDGILVGGLAIHLKYFPQLRAFKKPWLRSSTGIIKYATYLESCVYPVFYIRNIDNGIYQQKLQEYKKRQREITREMEAHIDADETCLLTIKTIVDLARRVKEIYLSSNLDEKRELLNLVFSNLKLREKRLLVTLYKPFSLLMAASHQPMYLQLLGTLRTFDWLGLSQEFSTLSKLIA